MIRPGAGVSRAGSIGMAPAIDGLPRPDGTPAGRARTGRSDGDGTARCRIANGRSTVGEARRRHALRPPGADRPGRRGPVRGAVP